MKSRHVLVAIVVLTFALRLYFAFSVPNYTYDSYFHIRHIEHVKNNFLPLTDDPLSFGGKPAVFAPLFHYFMAFFLFFLPSAIVYKVVPNLLLSLLPLAAYLNVIRLTSSKRPALFCAFLISLVPVLFSATLYSVTPLSLSLPLLGFALYYFSSLNTRNILAFILILTALSLVHPSSIVLVLSLGIYLVLVRNENLRLEKSELELVSFSAFMFLWLTFLVHKRALMEDGLSLMHHNVPNLALTSYFANVSLSNILILTGVIPVLGGFLALYVSVAKLRNKQAYLHFSVILSCILLMALGTLRFSVGLLYASISLCVLSGQAYYTLREYFMRTRFSLKLFTIPLVILTFVTMLVPTLYYANQNSTQTLQDNQKEALLWLRSNSNPKTTVLSTLREGHAVAALANRRNVADNYFVLVSDSEQRLRDIESMYTTTNAIKAFSLFEEYSVNYIYLTGNAREKYNIQNLAYSDEPCLKQVYDEGGVRIYSSRCHLKTT